MTDRKRANVYFDPKLYEKAKQKAEEMGLTFSSFIGLCVYEFLKQDSVLKLADIYEKMVAEMKSETAMEK